MKTSPTDSHFSFIFIGILFILIFSKCSKNNESCHITSRLSYADSIIEKNPAESLKIADSIAGSNPILNKSDRALLTLLKVQAREKLDLPLENDDELDEIIKYYRDNGSSNKLVRALYYRARYHWLCDSLSLAVQSISPAYEISIKNNDNFWAAKCADLFGEIYVSNYNSHEALKYFKEAAIYYNRANEIRYHRFALCDVGKMYSDIRDLDKAKSILDSLYQIARQENNDTLLITYSLSPLLPISVWEGRFSDTRKYFNELSRYANSDMPGTREYSYISRAELHLGNMEYARQLLDSAYSKATDYQDSGIAHIAKAELANLTGDHSTYNKSMDSIIKAINKMGELALSDSPTLDLKEIYKNKSEYEHSKSNTLRHIIVWVIITVFILGVVMFISYTLQIRKKNMIMTEMTENISNLHNQLKNLEQSVVNDKIRIIGKTLEDKMQLINNIYHEYDAKAHNPKLRDTFFKELKAIMDTLSSEEFIKKIKEANESLWPGMLDEIREKLDKLSKKDEDLIIYLFAGFNITTLSIICDESKSTLYTRRRRLSERIKESDIKNKEVILYILANGYSYK